MIALKISKDLQYNIVQLNFCFLLPNANDNLVLESVERIFSSSKGTSLETWSGIRKGLPSTVSDNV